MKHVLLDRRHMYKTSLIFSHIYIYIYLNLIFLKLQTIFEFFFLPFLNFNFSKNIFFYFSFNLFSKHFRLTLFLILFYFSRYLEILIFIQKCWVNFYIFEKLKFKNCRKKTLKIICNFKISKI